MLAPVSPGEEDAGASEDQSMECENQGESEEDHVAVQAIKCMTRPSKEDVEEHMINHIPFMPWCPHCVRGAAR